MSAPLCVVLALFTSSPAMPIDASSSIHAGVAAQFADTSEASDADDAAADSDASVNADVGADQQTPSPVSSSNPRSPDGAVASIDGALGDLLRDAVNPVRVAVPSFVDADSERSARLSATVANLLVDEGVDVVTANDVTHILGEEARAALEGAPQESMRALGADHLLLGEVADHAGAVVLDLRLIHVESGAVVGRALVDVPGLESRASVTRTTVRGAVDMLVDQIAVAIDALPGDARYQRVAILPLTGVGAASDGRLPRFVEAEMTKKLLARGFLVVERQRLNEAINEAAFALERAEENAPELGKALDAQALVIGTVAESGDVFVVTTRVIATDSAAVLGTASTTLKRDGAITLASDAIETHTPGEALFRSAVAPGWGQFYNRDPVKGTILGVATYAMAATTIVAATSTAAAYVFYLTYAPKDGTAPDVVARESKGRRQMTDALLWATVVSGAVTTTLWSIGVVDAFLVAGAE